MLMDPAFPDVVGQCVEEKTSLEAKIWLVERGPDGRLQERIDPSLLAAVATEEADGIRDALIIAAAQQEIAKTRIW